LRRVEVFLQTLRQRKPQRADDLLMGRSKQNRFARSGFFIY
jgi:hypothetical protein